MNAIARKAGRTARRILPTRSDESQQRKDARQVVRAVVLRQLESYGNFDVIDAALAINTDSRGFVFELTLAYPTLASAVPAVASGYDGAYSQRVRKIAAAALAKSAKQVAA